MNNYSATRTIIGHIEQGKDLYNTITRIAQEHRVTAGRITGMGAVQRATVAYYDQKEREYRDIAFDQPMEIVSLYGNISIKEGASFAHVHVVLSDSMGQCRGGHLLPGSTPVFACEIVMEAFDGPSLVRNTDETTGLALWSKDSIL